MATKEKKMADEKTCWNLKEEYVHLIGMNDHNHNEGM
jgi:hypothetical protein